MQSIFPSDYTSRGNYLSDSKIIFVLSLLKVITLGLIWIHVNMNIMYIVLPSPDLLNVKLISISADIFRTGTLRKDGIPNTLLIGKIETP